MESIPLKEKLSPLKIVRSKQSTEEKDCVKVYLMEGCCSLIFCIKSFKDSWSFSQIKKISSIYLLYKLGL